MPIGEIVLEKAANVVHSAIHGSAKMRNNETSNGDHKGKKAKANTAPDRIKSTVALRE